MSALIRALLLVMLACTVAAAQRTKPTRVLLADADPELHRAITAALAPWRVEVVVEAVQRPTDTTHAQMLGDAQTVRFIVWREHGDLVVFDRERGAAEHRVAPAGPLDAASAAAAALTVKTLMRLPPPEEVAEIDTTTEPAGGIVKPIVVEQSGAELRVQTGVATRVARGMQNQFGGRANLAVFLKPSSFALRLGVAGEIGTTSDVKDGAFKGTWRDWSVIGLASWAIALAPQWEIEPYVGAGVLRSMLDGSEGMFVRHKRETLVTLRAGTFVRMRAGRFSVGGMLGFDATPNTPAYTRGRAGSQFFEVPPFALSLGLIFAADLGR